MTTGKKTPGGAGTHTTGTVRFKPYDTGSCVPPVFYRLKNTVGTVNLPVPRQPNYSLFWLARGSHCVVSRNIPKRAVLRRRSLVLVRAPNGEPLTRVEMYGALRRQITPAAPTSLAPATEPFPADKKSYGPLDRGSIVDSESGSPSGKWPSKAFVLFRLFLALPAPMFLLFTGTQYSRRAQVAGWTGSFTELGAGYTLGVQVWLASSPPLVLSLLLAQIDYTGEALTERVFPWPTALEVALYLGSISAYLALYYIERLNLFAFGMFLASFGVGAFLYFATLVLRDIKKYQKLKKYKSFVRSQAVRAGIITMIMACVTTFALSAMLRVPIKATLLNVFVELSLNGIACADQAAFVSAFEASSANASCPALPNCGYATYEDLCQAVQYAPMVRALTDDTFDVNLFILASWLIISILILGTGRARANDGYSHLLSPHMLVAMVLGLVSLIMTLFSFMRLLLIVLRLSVPRPAPYFDRTGLMKKYELPLTCYGDCISIWFYGKIALYLLILFVLNFDFILKTVLLKLRDPNEVQKEQLEEAIKELRRQGWDDDAPSFYFIPADWVRACGTKSLPRMQTLREDGHLTKIKIPLASAFHEPAFCGGGIMANILFVSHRWEVPAEPDVDGEQLKAIKAFLEAHPDIKWVWFDYSSMPQKVDGVDTRTPEDKAEFQLMLAAIADLYLTARVLILLDGSYASRFWTLTEAWCSMQTVTSDGLRPATEAERRHTIECIHNADDEHDAKGLVDKVSTKTPDKMYGILKKPDVNVTNAKDKETMLPKILEIDRHVVDTFKKLGMLPEPKPAVATAAPNPVPALEKRYAIGSRVFLKRSNGEETLTYVNAYDEEEALYTVEIETLGSGQTEKCHDKDLRAAGVLEGLISSARASLFASKADDSDLHAS